jgi:dolichyl-phosphate-mannose-protein mannosyltransferase
MTAGRLRISLLPRLFRAAAAWLKTPAGGVAVLIIATLLARLALAAALGLGVDESYMVAAGRKLQLGYFDHPPIAWWMAWGAAHLTGNESPVIVRLPFIGLFAVTTFLMYRLTSVLFGPPAGFWAAVVLNLAPMFGISSAGWVLPDGPLLAALLGAAVCLVAALRSDRGAAWGWWLATGLCAGLALCSKYSALLTIIGAFGYLATERVDRSWLTRPHPYAAGLTALAVFSPVVLWNAEHGWASFLFQAGRAEGGFHPFGPITTLAGAAAFLLPWIWAPLVVCGFLALRRGPQDRERWLAVCLAAPPLIVFTAAALRGAVLFHWAAPGYLMLSPLLGDAIARNWPATRAVRVWLAGTAGFVLLGSSLFAAEVRFNCLPALIGDFRPGKDPSLDLVDWTSLKDDLTERGLLDRPNLVVAALRWSDAGKLDYALGGRLPIICIGPDARQYGLLSDRDEYAGADVLIVSRAPFAKIVGQHWFLFDRIEPLAPLTVLHAGRPALRLNLFLGHRLHEAAEECCAS